MKTSHLALGIGLPLAATLGCSFMVCHTGALPFDGQTAVPLDTTITFNEGWLSPDTPAMKDAVSLEDLTTGEQVPFSIHVVTEEGRVTLVPDSPLEPGHDYEAIGIGWTDTVHRGQEAWWGGAANRIAIVQFTTASDPRITDIISEDGSTVLLVLSEPVKPDQLELAFFVEDDDGGATPVDHVQLGSMQGLPHTMEVFVDRGDPIDAGMLFVESVHLAPALGTATAAVTDQGLRQDASWGLESNLDRLRGLTYCR